MNFFDRITGTGLAIILLAAATARPAVAQSPAEETDSDASRPFLDTTPPPEASQFDYLLGTWRFVAKTKNPAVPPTFEGRWTAWPAFDGFGITDEWRVLTPTGETAFLGTTARVYDRESGVWELQFLDVFRGNWNDQYAVWRDGEMHLWWKGQDGDGPFLVRVRYFDIEADSFRWRLDRSYDGGATWIENFLTMEVTRIAEGEETVSASGQE